MNALQKQREDIRDVRARLGWARPAAPVVVLRPVTKPVKWIAPQFVYLLPVGPLRPPSGERAVQRMPSYKLARLLLNAAAAKHGVPVSDILSDRRPNRVVHCRWELMWELRQQTTWSTPQIAKFLGGRDHTTILHGVKRHEQRMREAGQ
jgi:hypothetical protein